MVILKSELDYCAPKVEKVILFADADSRLKWCRKSAERFYSEAQVTIVVSNSGLDNGDLRNNVGAFHVVCSLEAAVLEVDFSQFDALFAALSGSKLNWLICYVKRLTSRPIIVTGYEGLVYEKSIEGLLWRCGSDVILVNSPRDFSLFSKALLELGVGNESLLLDGFSTFRSNTVKTPKKTCRNIVFATQPTVPEGLEERIFLLKQLSSLAANYPQYRIIVKPRVQPGEGANTPHFERFHYQVLYQKLLKFGEIQDNLVFVYGEMSDVLEDDCKLMLSVSSTALIEAALRGIPAAALTDLGVRESYGNHFFVGSGMLTKLADALQMEPLCLETSEWAAQNGLLEESVVDRAKLKKREVPVFYSKEGEPYLKYLETSAIVSEIRFREIFARIFRKIRGFF